jgi:hypothetical protein
MQYGQMGLYAVFLYDALVSEQQIEILTQLFLVIVYLPESIL